MMHGRKLLFMLGLLLGMAHHFNAEEVRIEYREVGQNYVKVDSLSSFFEALNTSKGYSSKTAFGFFYDGNDNPTDQINKLRRDFIYSSTQHPDVLFIEIDVAIDDLRMLVEHLNLTELPIFIVFRDADPVTTREGEIINLSAPEIEVAVDQGIAMIDIIDRFIGGILILPPWLLIDPWWFDPWWLGFPPWWLDPLAWGEPPWWWEPLDEDFAPEEEPIEEPEAEEEPAEEAPEPEEEPEIIVDVFPPEDILPPIEERPMPAPAAPMPVPEREPGTVIIDRWPVPERPTTIIDVWPPIGPGVTIPPWWWHKPWREPWHKPWREPHGPWTEPSDHEPWTKPSVKPTDIPHKAPKKPTIKPHAKPVPKPGVSTRKPTRPAHKPTRKLTKPAHKPTRKPTRPAHKPTRKPTKPKAKPKKEVTKKPTRQTHRATAQRQRSQQQTRQRQTRQQSRSSQRSMRGY